MIVAVLAALCLLVCPSTLVAQGGFQFTPYVGGWLPFGPVSEGIESSGPVQRSQVGDILLGARGGWKFGPRYVVEAGVAVSPGQAALTNGAGTSDIPGWGIIGSSRVSARTPLNSSFDGHFAGGFGVIGRRGEGWPATQTAVALSAAAGMQTDLAAGRTFRVEAEIFASRGQRTGLGTTPGGRWRADLVVSFGLVLAPRR